MGLTVTGLHYSGPPEEHYREIFKGRIVVCTHVCMCNLWHLRFKQYHPCRYPRAVQGDKFNIAIWLFKVKCA
ncbi:protein of unknown function [Pseudomonas mediterranea]